MRSVLPAGLLFISAAAAWAKADDPSFGAGTSVTAGGVGGASVPTVNDENVRARLRGRALRLTAGSPSYSQSIISETLTWKVPVAERLGASAAMTLEQATSNNVYFTAGLYYHFR